MEDFDALAASDEVWRAGLADFRPEWAGDSSILPGWTVHDLVNHVLGGCVRYLLLLRGTELAIVEATRDNDHVRSEPLRCHRSYAEPLNAEFREPGALERTVHHRAGAFSGLELLRMHVLEQTLHAWDLARSLDLDDELPADLVEHLLETSSELVLRLREAGRYGSPAARPRSSGSAQARLLALTGRDRHVHRTMPLQNRHAAPSAANRRFGDPRDSRGDRSE
jgi:uncharacterized protein (TIGR03086 family)